MIEPKVEAEIKRTLQDAAFGYAQVNNQVYSKHVRALMTEIEDLRDRLASKERMDATTHEGTNDGRDDDDEAAERRESDISGDDTGGTGGDDGPGGGGSELSNRQTRSENASRKAAGKTAR